MTYQEARQLASEILEQKVDARYEDLAHSTIRIPVSEGSKNRPKSGYYEFRIDNNLQLDYPNRMWH